MSVTITKKTDYKLKNVQFVDGNFINENGEVVDLVNELSMIFCGEPFDLNASNTDKVHYPVNYFEDKKDFEDE